MSNSTYFSQECPTCGRKLLIRVEYMGKRVVCQHCQGELLACDPATLRFDDSGHSSKLLKRAEELLDAIGQRENQNRSQYPR